MRKLYFFVFLILTGFGVSAQPEAPLGNNALVFSGVPKLGASTHIRFANGLFETSAFTIEMWIRTTAPTGNNRCIYSAKTAGGDTRMSLHVSSEGRIGIWNGLGWQDISTPVPFDTWMHVAFSISATNTTVFTNGVQRGIIPLSFRSSVTNTIPRIGVTGDYASTENWRGAIDEVRIWDVPRTAIQVAADMNDRSTTNATNLLGYYNFDQGSPGGYNKTITEAIDRTSAQRNGTLVNFRRAPYTYSNFVANGSGVLVESFTGTRLFVNGLSANGGSGTAWQTPCTNLADALEIAGVASQNITIYVAKGIYTPGDDPSETFLVSRRGISLYGGYGGIDTNLNVRDPKLNETILSGEIGSPSSPADNSVHVISFVADDHSQNTANGLDGFTIRDGYASGEVVSVNGKSLNGYSGAAIYIESSQTGYSCIPLVSNCLILDNSAMGIEDNSENPRPSGFGSAVRIDASDGGNAVARFESCVFAGSRAYKVSGAVMSVLTRNGRSDVALKNCVFTGNSGDDDLIYYDAVNATSELSFINNTVYGNKTLNFIHSLTDNLNGKINFTNNIILNGAAELLDENHYNDPLRNYVLRYNLFEIPVVGNNNIQTSRSDFFRNVANPTGADGIWRTPDDGFNLKACGIPLDTGLNINVGVFDIIGESRSFRRSISRGAYEGMTASVVLSTPASNDTPFEAEGCDGDVFTPYAIPGKPGNRSLSIAWGQNSTARDAAIITVNTVAANNVVTGTGSGTAAMRRYWNVDLNGAFLTEPVTLRFYFDAADTAAMKAALSGVGAVSDIRWVKTNGVPYAPSQITPANLRNDAFTWLTPSAKGLENGVAFVEFSGITSFSGGGAVAVAGSALPVRLTSLKSKTKDCGVQLDWSVADAVNFKGYEVERSANGAAYAPVGKLAHNSGKNAYSFTDASLPGSGKYLYRLKLVDVDGKFVYSDVLSAESNCSGVLNRIVIAPNPVCNELNIQFNGEAKNAVVNIRGLAGNLVSSTRVTGSVSSIKIPVASLQAGIYLVELNTAAGKTITQKIIKQ